MPTRHLTTTVNTRIKLISWEYDTYLPPEHTVPIQIMTIGSQWSCAIQFTWLNLSIGSRNHVAILTKIVFKWNGDGFGCDATAITHRQSPKSLVKRLSSKIATPWNLFKILNWIFLDSTQTVIEVELERNINNALSGRCDQTKFVVRFNRINGHSPKLQHRNNVICVRWNGPTNNANNAPDSKSNSIARPLENQGGKIKWDEFANLIDLRRVIYLKNFVLWLFACFALLSDSSDRLGNGIPRVVVIVCSTQQTYCFE